MRGDTIYRVGTSFGLKGMRVRALVRRELERRGFRFSTIPGVRDMQRARMLYAEGELKPIRRRRERKLSAMTLRRVAKNKVHGLKGRLKTHCRKGHELTPENVYFYAGKNERQCRLCRKAGNKAYYERIKAHNKRFKHSFW